MQATSTKLEEFMDTLHKAEVLNEEAMTHVRYDRPYFDGLIGTAVVDPSSYGYNHITHAS